MKKKVITKPRFGKIFAVRFLISLVVFVLIGGYYFYQFDYNIWNEVDGSCVIWKHNIIETTKTLSSEKPDSEKYKQDLDQLKLYIANYQRFDHSYIEVNLHDQKITLGDTAFFFLGENIEAVNYPDENIVRINDYFFIEDIYYLDPVKAYNSSLDLKEQDEFWRKWNREPIVDGVRTIGKYDRYITYKLQTAYINRETHTFLPGMVLINYMDQDYKVDCTPVDTKGYEKMDFTTEYGNENGMDLEIRFRVAPELTSSDFLYVIVPDPIFEIDEIEPDELNNLLSKGQMNQYSWYIGYSAPYYSLMPALELAPVTSTIIILATVIAALISALVFAVIKYQKEKTVWNIFEYRTKTTEAMAHDLKTPLSSMMFYLEDLEDSSKDPEKVREYAKTLNDKVVGMDHMIADILQFSRSESGKVDLNKEKVSVKELVFESLKEFPEMKTEIRGEDISLTTDRKILAQVIMNLLSNCDRYGRKGEVVDIEFAPEAVTISNKTDKTYEDADSLKKPFVKGDNSRGNKGTGLGLAIADNALSILGYKLELSSEADEFKAKVKFR